jgi:hypothetical protein
LRRPIPREEVFISLASAAIKKVSVSRKVLACETFLRAKLSTKMVSNGTAAKTKELQNKDDVFDRKVNSIAAIINGYFIL